MTDRIDYAPHFAALAEAEADRVAAENALRRHRAEIRNSALAEANASLARAGVVIGETLLTLKGRWEYQNRPVLIRLLTCWSTPLERPQNWQFQAHYVRARKDGKPYKDGQGDYWNVVVDHPADAGAAVRKRLPIWGERRND